MAARKRSLIPILGGAIALATCDAAPVSSAEKAATEVVYAAIGDSTGVGVGAMDGGYVRRLFVRLEKVRPGSRLLNLCESGATTDGALRDQLPRLGAGPAPSLVTIGIGANDATRGISVSEFGRRFEAIVKGVRARTKGVIVVSNLPDFSLAPAIPPFFRDEASRRIRALNAEIAATAARHRAVVFDAFAMSRNVLPKHPEFFSSDGFHPSDQGYEFWAEHLWSVVRGVL